jgi:glucose-6-phosphate 1-epimerase
MTYEETDNPLRGVEARPGSGHYGVYDHGAHIWAYQPNGAAEPILWMSEKSQFADGEPIRGGIPIIFPWFATGPAGDKAPSHGFGRLTTWHRSDIKDTIAQDGRLLVEYELDDSMAKEAGFSFEYTAYVRCKFTPEYLQISMEVSNDGEDTFTFENGLHTYLAVGDVRQITLDGLDGCSYEDRTVGADKPHCTQEGAVTISAETDRIYAHRGDVVVTDPVLGRTLTVSKSGSFNTVVWNPWVDKAAAMADFGDDEWTGMICIEATNVLDSAITLRPGMTHTMRQRISLS